MEYWAGQGIREFILSVGYKKEVIQAHFGNNFQGCKVRYVIESSPLGTGGALLRAVEKADPARPFLALNGDTIFRVDLDELAAFHEEYQAEWTLALFESDDRERYLQVKTDAEGRVISAGTGTDEERFPANGGVYVISPRVLKQFEHRCGQKLSLEDEIMPILISVGARVYAKTCTGLFVDIGVPQDYFWAQQLLGAEMR